MAVPRLRPDVRDAEHAALVPRRAARPALRGPAAGAARRDHLRAHLVLKRRIDDPRLAVEYLEPHYYLHRFTLTGPADVDAELTAWVAEAYRVGAQLTPAPREQLHLGRVGRRREADHLVAARSSKPEVLAHGLRARGGALHDLVGVLADERVVAAEAVAGALLGAVAEREVERAPSCAARRRGRRPPRVAQLRARLGERSEPPPPVVQPSAC